MTTFLLYLSLLGILSVLVVLGIGIYSLVKGGAFRTNWSNKLMRLRVILQAVTIAILCLFAWISSSHG